MILRLLSFISFLYLISAQSPLDYNDITDRTVVLRLEPQPKMPNFLRSAVPPKVLETSAPKVEVTKVPQYQPVSNRPMPQQWPRHMADNMQKPEQQVQQIAQPNMRIPPLQQMQQLQNQQFAQPAPPGFCLIYKNYSNF